MIQDRPAYNFTRNNTLDPIARNTVQLYAIKEVYAELFAELPRFKSPQGVTSLSKQSSIDSYGTQHTGVIERVCVI